MRRDLACAALGLALAGAYWAAANALPESRLADAVGADGVPKALAGLLALFSLAIGGRALFGPSQETQPEKRHLRALGIAGLGFAYVAIASFVGYFLAIALLAGSAALYYGARRPAGIALFAVGVAVMLSLVFGRLLGIPLPG